MHSQDIKLRVPECFADHILVSDAVVGQGLAPDRVESVVQGLGSKFIGLKDKPRRRPFNRIEHHYWLTADSPLTAQESSSLKCQVSLKCCQNYHYHLCKSIECKCIDVWWQACKRKLAAAYWTLSGMKNKRQTTFTWSDGYNQSNAGSEWCWIHWS